MNVINNKIDNKLLNNYFLINHLRPILDPNDMRKIWIHMYIYYLKHRDDMI